MRPRPRKPRRWVVERTLGWLSKCRASVIRYDKHWQNDLGSVATGLRPALVGVDPTVVSPGAIWALGESVSSRRGCVAKVESSATRPHPLDSEGFLCRESLSRNLGLVRRVSQQGDRDTSLNPCACRGFLQMAPGDTTVGSTPTSDARGLEGPVHAGSRKCRGCRRGPRGSPHESPRRTADGPSGRRDQA